MARTSVVHKEEKTFTFKMQDADVLARVDEVNELKSQVDLLDSKKKLIANEQKQLKSDCDFKLSCIARREEPRKVDCNVVHNYADRTIEVVFDGEIMESRKMNDWEFEERPVDIFPETHKHKPDEVHVEQPEGDLEGAVKRATEIEDKTEKLQTPSANTNQFSEAKTETAAEGLNV